MVEYEPTKELLENFFNPEKRIQTLERWLSEGENKLKQAHLEK